MRRLRDGKSARQPGGTAWRGPRRIACACIERNAAWRGTRRSNNRVVLRRTLSCVATVRARRNRAGKYHGASRAGGRSRSTTLRFGARSSGPAAVAPNCCASAPARRAETRCTRAYQLEKRGGWGGEETYSVLRLELSLRMISTPPRLATPSTHDCVPKSRPITGLELILGAAL